MGESQGEERSRRRKGEERRSKGGKRVDGEEGERKREEKRVNFTTRKMRVYRPVVRKGRGESARSEAR